MYKAIQYGHDKVGAFLSSRVFSFARQHPSLMPNLIGLKSYPMMPPITTVWV